MCVGSIRLCRVSAEPDAPTLPTAEHDPVLFCRAGSSVARIRSIDRLSCVASYTPWPALTAAFVRLRLSLLSGWHAPSSCIGR